MFFPLADENPTSRKPVVVYAIIAVNVAVWLFELVHGETLSTLDYGAIPAWLLHHVREGQILLPTGEPVLLHQEVPWPWTIITSMFMHGGWLHIIFNMWFFWIFGDNLEDRMGPLRFFAFYMICGIVAALTQILASGSSVVPMVGASGAIAGVMGGYLLLYPRARVRCLVVLIIFITTIRVPAWLLLGFWFLEQFAVPSSSGVAWMAHVGGFVCGIALVKLFVKSPPAAVGPQQIYYA